MKLHFKKIGKGPVIVILHGLFGMSDNWMTIAKTLAEDYCFYLLDLRNHGNSPHSIDFNYDLMASDVAEFINEHNLKDVNLVGHSMGGKVAMRFAVSHPELIKKLVVVDIMNKNYIFSYFDDYINAMLAIDFREIGSRKEAEKAFLKTLHVYPGVLQFLFKNLNRNEKNTFSWKVNLESLRENLPLILKSVDIPKPVTIKTLFMNGSESDYISEQDTYEIKNQFLNARIAEINGANHWVHSTAPLLFMEALTNFINN